MQIKNTIVILVIALTSIYTLSSAHAEVITFDATIKSVDTKTRTISIERKGKLRELDVSRKAKITIGGKKTELGDLEAGQQVSLSYHDDLEIVLKIEATDSGSSQFEGYSASSKNLKLVSVEQIWNKSPSNAFTDLCFHGNHFYCVFREGENRLSKDGSIRILKSADTMSWEPVAQIKHSKYDLRDAKISVTADQQLMVTMGGSQRRNNKLVNFQTLASYSQDGKKWTKPSLLGESEMWLWNPTWNGSELYAVGYHANEPWYTKLYRSSDGRQTEIVSPVFTTENMPVETALAFPSPKQAICVQRRGKGSKTASIGFSTAPFTDWSWNDSGLQIGSPDLLALPDGRIILACRVKESSTQTALFWLNPESKKLNKIISLPGSGDQGYPGVIFANGHLWVSYHSSHEQNTAIYIAKLRFTD